MISNRYIGIALVSLLVLVLGAMVTIIVMLSNERPVQASGAALGKYIVTTMQVSDKEEALAVMDTSNNSIVVYRCWNGNTFYPVSGRKMVNDHKLLDLVNNGHFYNVRPLETNYTPEAIDKRLNPNKG
ncbi:MAG: hypothetical protein ABIH04_11360 [Planctomycetota bacterium]